MRESCILWWNFSLTLAPPPPPTSSPPFTPRTASGKWYRRVLVLSDQSGRCLPAEQVSSLSLSVRVLRIHHNRYQVSFCPSVFQKSTTAVVHSSYKPSVNEYELIVFSIRSYSAFRWTGRRVSIRPCFQNPPPPSSFSSCTVSPGNYANAVCQSASCFVAFFLDSKAYSLNSISLSCIYTTMFFILTSGGEL